MGSFISGIACDLPGMDEESRYQAMPVSELKSALARLKASTKGRKPDLVDR